VLPGSLFGLPLVTSGGGRCTCPVFGELPIAHQIVGQVHQADLHFKSLRQANGADEFPPHADFLEAEDVLDTGADLGARAVVRLLLAVGCTDLHAHMRRGRLEAADDFVLRVDTDVILVAERVIAALSRPAPIPRKREETKALPRDRGGSAAPAGRPLAEAL